MKRLLRTVSKTIVGCFVFVVLLYTIGWEFGPESCYGCRRERGAFVVGGLRLSTIGKDTECSVWIRENVPSHDHLWVRSGGWSGARYACALYFGAPPIRAKHWLEALEAGTPQEREELLRSLQSLRQSDEKKKVGAELHRRVEELRARSTAPNQDAAR